MTRKSIIDEPIYVGMDPGKSGAMVALYFDGTCCDALAMPVFGWNIHWLVYFFVLSLAFGFAFKGVFGVQI